MTIRLTPEARRLAADLVAFAAKHGIDLYAVRGLTVAVEIAEAANPEEGDWDETSKLQELLDAWSENAQEAHNDDLGFARPFLED